VTASYNPESEYLGDDASSSSESRPASPVAPLPRPKPASRPAWQPQPSTISSRFVQHPQLGPRRASSLPFGSAAALGGRTGRYNPAIGSTNGRSGSGDARSAEKTAEQAARSRGRHMAFAAGVADGPSAIEGNTGGEMRKREVPRPVQPETGRDVEAARPTARRSDSETSEEEGPESPEMNIQVSIGVLVAATGLTCGCIGDVLLW
jgi:hypothetical protein